MGSKHRPSTAQSFIIGTGSAFLSKTATAPIGRIKLLLQNQGELLISGRLETPYKGIINCIARTYRTEGVLSFWKGNLINCLGHVPSQAVNFALKDLFRTLIKINKDDSFSVKITKNVMTGGLSGFASLLLVYPFGYCYVRLANDVKTGDKLSPRQFNGIIDVYRKTLASDGIPGMYRGLTASCLGIVVYRGLYFGLYDTLKPFVVGDLGGNFLAMFALGYIVTLTAGIMSYPLDTIKSRMMMRSIEKVKYRGTFDCGKQIIRNEGFMALMKGVSMNIISGVVGAGMLVGYDMFKNSYARSRSRD